MPASVTLFVFLAGQILGPRPVSAHDTLRTEPITETAGLEELEAKFRQPSPAAHPTQTVLSGLEEPDAGKVEEHFVNRQRASIQRLWFEKRVLPANHPATRYVRKQLKQIARTIEPELFVIEDEEENAFAAGTNQIYVTTGMLRILETEEELLALLMHELTHIERKDAFFHRNSDPFDLYVLGIRRLAEFYADTAMLLELDKRGANPIGAIHFTKKMAALIEEKRHDPKYGKILANLEDWDPVHGSAAQRHINMRELVRFVDLRHLSEETHAIAPNRLKLGQAEPKKMTKRRAEKLPDLKPENFWRSFGRLVQDYPQAVWSEVARKFIRNQGVKLTADEERVLFLVIHFHLLKSQEPFALNESGQTKSINREEAYRYFAPQAVIGLFERNVFERIGLWLTPHELISIGEESFKNALKDKPVDHFKTEVFALDGLRRQVVDYHQRWYGHSINFVPEWDANLVSAFLVEHAVQGEARYFFEDVQTIVLGQRATDKRVIFENEIPLQVIPKKVLQEFLTLNGIGLVTLDTVLEKVEDALKITPLFSRVILEQEDGRKVERHVIYKLDDPKVLRFQRTLQDLLAPIVSSAMPFVQNRQLNVFQALDNAILLSGTLGRIRSGGTEKTERYEGEEYLLFMEEFIREVPMQRILTLFRSVAQRADRMSSARFTQEIRAWYSDLANESDRKSAFYDILDLLSDHLANKHDWEYRLGQDELDEKDYLTNEEIEKMILLKLYKSQGFEKRFLQGADGIVGTRNSKILLEPGQFISWLRRRIEEANESGFASQWTFGVRDKNQLHNLMVEIKHETLEQMSRSTPETIFKLALELESKWGIAFVNMPRAAYEEHWAEISKRLNGYLKQHPDFPGTAQDFERILALSLLSQESFSAMSLSAVFLSEEIQLPSPDHSSRRHFYAGRRKGQFARGASGPFRMVYGGDRSNA